MNAGVAGSDEPAKERVRGIRFAQELGVELAGDVEGMVLQFHQFHEFSIGGISAENKACLLILRAVMIVELVSMTMTFMDEESSIKLGGF